MWFLIHTKTHPRPHLTTNPFLARDFHIWGFQVDTHASETDYIKEVRLREKIENQTKWRLELLEIWAREVVSRKQQDVEQGRELESQEDERAAEEHLTYYERRLQRTSRLAQDFINGIAAFGECGCEVHEWFTKVNRFKVKPGYVNPAFPTDPRPIPLGAVGLISKYMRLVQVIYFNDNTTRPTWVHPSFTHVAHVSVDFLPYPAVKREHLIHAMNKALSMGRGRMGRLEKSTQTGVYKVNMYVDVGDCVGLSLMEVDGELDPVPLYQKVDDPPEYE